MPLKARYQASLVQTKTRMAGTLTEAENAENQEKWQLAGEIPSTDKKDRHTQNGNGVIRGPTRLSIRLKLRLFIVILGAHEVDFQHGRIVVGDHTRST